MQSIRGWLEGFIPKDTGYGGGRPWTFGSEMFYRQWKAVGVSREASQNFKEWQEEDDRKIKRSIMRLWVFQAKENEGLTRIVCWEGQQKEEERTYLITDSDGECGLRQRKHLGWLFGKCHGSRRMGRDPG